ncbi:MAG: DUF3048 domain-containing protein, partial [Chloroflexi bacterium]|nr:DUF3048 domain-containing protein [Chloroflexota bacterium]
MALFSTGRLYRKVSFGAFALAAILVFLAGCNSHTPAPTSTPVRTYTPKPTFTPYPTATPPPTATPQPTETPLPTVPATPTAEPTATPNPFINPLSGQRVEDPAKLARRVLAVRIGNDPEIRPQEGLGQAEIVYEEVMDGWVVTRFTAIYLARDVERLRPIRSARLSSLAIAPQYDAALVHSGASDKIRWLISQAKDFVDLDEYFNPGPYAILAGYDWRGRMYTSVPAVHAYLSKKGLERTSPISGYTFSEAVPQGQPAKSIHIPYPRTCVVDWVYDEAHGRYLRSVQGKPHLEGLTGEQIGAENVILFYTEHKKTDIVEDTLGSTAIDIVMVGSGRA